MARKYECSPGRYAWNFEKCEEVIIIAGYDEVRRFIASDLTWNQEFESHFFDHGNGVAFDFLDRINSERRRRGLDIIVIEETDILDYGRSPDKLMKSEHRRRVRSEISDASVDVRQNFIEAAKAAAARLLPPHVTCEEFLQKRRLRQRSDA